MFDGLIVVGYLRPPPIPDLIPAPIPLRTGDGYISLDAFTSGYFIVFFGSIKFFATISGASSCLGATFYGIGSISSSSFP
jgi:hypothetical protein